MKVRFCLTLLMSLAFFATSVRAETAPTQVLRVAVLHSGTVNWELQHLKNQSLDKQNGFVLELNRVASLSAARLALTSGSADMIVSDWLWAGKRNQDGASLRFIPFSSQVGGVVRKDATQLSDLTELRGKTIGVAGGPLNKSWILLQAAAKAQGVELRKEATIQFGAPPLLSQALKRGQLDLLLTFWHYAAKLEVEGYHQVLSLENLMAEMGMHSRVPMLGYLFNAEFEKENSELVSVFDKALKQTKEQLLTEDQHWEVLKPLMKADSPEVFSALQAGYRKGIPEVMTPLHVEDAQRFYQLIDQMQPFPEGGALSGEVFYGITSSTEQDSGVKE